MQTPQVNTDLQNKVILEHWQEKAIKDFPDHALRAQKIMNQLLQKHDPEKWKAYTFQKEPEFDIHDSLGLAHYLIAQILYNYERLGRDIDEVFLIMCKTHLQLLPHDGEIPSWVNPLD